MALVWSINSFLAKLPVPLTAWYVETLTLLIFCICLNESITITKGVVVQLGVEIIPLCHSTSSPLTSGTTSGTVSSILNVEPSSITNTFLDLAISANSLLTSEVAEIIIASKEFKISL